MFQLATTVYILCMQESHSYAAKQEELPLVKSTATNVGQLLSRCGYSSRKSREPPKRCHELLVVQTLVIDRASMIFLQFSHCTHIWIPDNHWWQNYFTGVKGTYRVRWRWRNNNAQGRSRVK
jgi:hypothetical protein